MIALFLEAFKAEIKCRASFLFWLALSIFLVVSGPFGSYQTMTLGERIAIGLPVLIVFMIIGVLIRAVVFYQFERFGFRLAAIATAGAAVIVMSPMCLALFKMSPLGRHVTSPSFFELSILISSLSLGHSALRQLTQADQDELSAEDGAQASVELVESRGRLLHRIEPAHRGPIQSISVRDHYVDVNTGKSQVSLLLRFSDAMAEVDPDAGAQVHRSHWVAWEAIETVERNGTKLYLKLKHGARIPVSKNHRDKLEARGLL